MGFFEELKQRHMVRWTLGYAAAAYGAMQAAQLVWDVYELPAAVLRALPVVLIGGLLITAVLSWYHGEGGDQRAAKVELILITFIIGLTAAVALPISRGTKGVSADDVVMSSVAVLPFVDLSQSKDQEYFGDGITEEILNVLAQMPGLKVPGRTSSFSFKNKNVPIPEIAKQLGVAHVLEGSVRKAGDRVRITAQLIDARNDKHLWSQDYDRDVADIFAVQDEIAHAIAQSLRLKIAESARLADAETESSEAHEHYLKGLYYWNRRHTDELPLAIDEFKAAVKADPNYARAHSGVALGYTVLCQYQRPCDLVLANREGVAAARRALALDPGAVEAHAALGAMAQNLEWNWPKAMMHLDSAVALDPNNATAHHWRAEALNAAGRFDEGLTEINRALEIEPLSSVMANVKGFSLFGLGRPQDASDLLWGIVNRDPSFTLAGQNLFAIEVMRGRIDLARKLAKKFPGSDLMLDGLTDRAKREIFMRAITFGNVPPVAAWVFYGLLGERDSTLAVLERGAAARDPMLSQLISYPTFDFVRNEPRYQKIRSLMRLPAAANSTASQ